MRHTLRLLQATDPTIIRQTFTTNFTRLWRQAGSPKHIGLAISGGVDSMAMAQLCQTLTSNFPTPLTFTAFIADHQLRPTSTQEAHQTAQTLSTMSIPARILPLTFPPSSSAQASKHAPNLESIARRLRYRALGAACRDAGINTLLVAHHADDQAETVLMRLVSGYTGTGLRGISERGRIPECDGMYGVHRSGQPRVPWEMVNGRSVEDVCGMGIEAGGVNLMRPLLGLGKEDLRAVCVEGGVKWCEDETNEDRTLTVRNAVRGVLGSESLPGALKKEAWMKIGMAASARAQEPMAAHWIFEQIEIELKTYVCEARVSFERDLVSRLEYSEELKYRIYAVLCRKILQLVRAVDTISLHDLHNTIEFIFGDRATLIQDQRTALQVGGVEVRAVAAGDGKKAFVLRRQKPHKHALVRAYFPIGRALQQEDSADADHDEQQAPTESEWILWDNRYWIRLENLQTISKSSAAIVERIWVEFLTLDRFAQLRKSLPKAQREGLNRFLGGSRMDARETLPAVITDLGGKEEIIFLPSIGWRRYGSSDSNRVAYGLLGCEIHYRAVELGRTENHKIAPDLEPSVKGQKILK